MDLEALLKTPNSTRNRLAVGDSAAHDWYRFVVALPPHLVREYVARFGLDAGSRVLIPFRGTGTTLVECKKQGVPSVGIDAHPMTPFASSVKTEWSSDPAALLEHARRIAMETEAALAADGIDDGVTGGATEQTAYRSLFTESAKLRLKQSVSPRPLPKTLVLLDLLQADHDGRCAGHERLALAKAVVAIISNLHFEPEVEVGPPKADAPVIGPWLAAVESMAAALRTLQATGGHDVPAEAKRADARDRLGVLEPHSIDAVVRSPPDPNEKDYTRTTRLESVLLGFISTKQELQAVKRGLVRSNTRTGDKGDDDARHIVDHHEIERIAQAIAARRLALGKTSGCEWLYPHVTRLYFGGMAKHLADLRTILRPGAQLAHVVGDQASYPRVMIRTRHLLAEIGTALGYDVVGLDLFRTRLATATREQMREEVVVPRWPVARRRQRPPLAA